MVLVTALRGFHFEGTACFLTSSLPACLALPTFLLASLLNLLQALFNISIVLLYFAEIVGHRVVAVSFSVLRRFLSASCPRVT